MGTLQAYAHDMAKFLATLTGFLQYAKLLADNDLPIDEKMRDTVSDWLEHVIPQTKELCLDLSIKGIHRAQDALKHDPPRDVANALEEVCNRIVDELKNVMFLRINPGMVEYYNSKNLFGIDDTKINDLIIEDIGESLKCFALNRYTACVFHLMRVMEQVVQIFGKKLRIKIDPKHETWYQILVHVNKAIEKLPDKTTKQKEKKLKYKAASAHLDNVRIAWRNEVMHPKQTYTKEEAEDVINSVRIFVNDLAVIL